jgi:hypothetical protein
MHLDPAFLLIVEGMMLKMRDREIGSQFPICASKDVPIELGSHSIGIVVSAVQHIRIFL